MFPLCMHISHTSFIQIIYFDMNLRLCICFKDIFYDANLFIDLSSSTDVMFKPTELLSNNWQRERGYQVTAEVVNKSVQYMTNVVFIRTQLVYEKKKNARGIAQIRQCEGTAHKQVHQYINRRDVDNVMII